MTAIFVDRSRPGIDDCKRVRFVAFGISIVKKQSIDDQILARGNVTALAPQGCSERIDMPWSLHCMNPQFPLIAFFLPLSPDLRGDTRIQIMEQWPPYWIRVCLSQPLTSQLPY